MAELSPQAQAVLDALCMEELSGPQQLMARAHAAAALRAAADQVAPEDLRECQAFTNEAIRLNIQEVRRKLLAIAAELEAT